MNRLKRWYCRKIRKHSIPSFTFSVEDQEKGNYLRNNCKICGDAIFATCFK